MRLLLDTNVLVAALIARGACSDVLEHSVRQHEVVSSQPLLKELREVLQRKFRQRAIDVRAALLLFGETFTMVTPNPLESPVCRDPDDDIVLATALAGACERSSRAIRICWCSIRSEGFACWHPRRSGSGRLSSTTSRDDCLQPRLGDVDGDAIWPSVEPHDERDRARCVRAVIRLPRVRRRPSARNRLGPFVTRGP